MTDVELFNKTIQEFIDSTKLTKFKWNQKDEIEFKGSEPDGFDVGLRYCEGEIYFYTTTGAHEHFLYGKGDADDSIHDALGMVYDYLSPLMRIKVTMASNFPYKWEKEMNYKGDWKRVSIMAQPFFNYFGKRTVKYVMNSVLPIRKEYDQQTLASSQQHA